MRKINEVVHYRIAENLAINARIKQICNIHMNFYNLSQCEPYFLGKTVIFKDISCSYIHEYIMLNLSNNFSPSLHFLSRQMVSNMFTSYNG